ncbi:hypothetical protein [Clostridium sp. Marseille-P299]|uniref:hypothetical protein n=1 Tax=Clostridium sp. Marseille-P299 TaxID=1805477 RepID=UPI0008326841|nr:hypothetical protein [Clostridium sp. Marseille-P299]
MKNKNKALKLIGIIVILLAILFIPLKRDIWDKNANNLKRSLHNMSDNTIIEDFSEWTPFEWDTIYSFAPYTSKDRIYEVVGYKWDRISETVNEGMDQIVFMKDGKVVCYLYGYPGNTKIGFDFGNYNGNYIKLTSDQKLSFKTILADKGVMYLEYLK